MECYAALLAELSAAVTVWLYAAFSLRLLAGLLAGLWVGFYLFFALYWIPRYCRIRSCETAKGQLVLTRGVFRKRTDYIDLSRINGITLVTGLFGRLFGTSTLLIYTPGGLFLLAALPREMVQSVCSSWEAG